ncbi:MAG: DUF4352 domain-containing protein [Chloroflexi bacterium]|nr:DUF4352 domain-containing protein [Chloroflexota bacterium]
MVEVFKEVELVKEVPVEVVREVEVVVVATPTQIPMPLPSPTLGPTETPTPTATPSPTPEPPSTPAELVGRVQDSIVRVEARTGGFVFFQSSGSGFIFAVEGTTAFVATNHHVIDGKSSVEVQLKNSETYDAVVLGWDAERDVAVLSICCSSDFIALQWGETSPSEGESVIAVGYPDSDAENVIATIGEVRAPDDLSTEHDFIPHSAPLNPGNSGGPLFSMPGAEVVGINTARNTETLAFYAVPFQAIEEQVEEWRAQLIIAPTATPTFTPTPSPTPTFASAPSLTPAITFSRVKVNGVVYTVHSIIDPAPLRRGLSTGERAVAVDVSLEAVENNIDYDYAQFSVQDSDGYIHDPDFINRGVEPDLSRGTLAIGQRVRGWVNFNVAEHAKLTAVQVETGYGSPRVVIAYLARD